MLDKKFPLSKFDRASTLLFFILIGIIQAILFTSLILSGFGYNSTAQPMSIFLAAIFGFFIALMALTIEVLVIILIFRLFLWVAKGE